MTENMTLSKRPAGFHAEPVLHRARTDHAPGMVEVIHAAFGARPPVDPPSTAGEETPGSVAAAVAAGSGVYATVEDRPAGAIILDVAAGGATLRRVSVHPDFQRHGIAGAMICEAELLAAESGARTVELSARAEFPELIGYWRRRGFTIIERRDRDVILQRRVPVSVQVPTSAAMHQLGGRLSQWLTAGDVIIAAGELGAGKTTLTQGIGDGLNVDGPIISPTFVLSRVHRARGTGPALVHVDGYRLTGSDELEDLDLEESLGHSVTVVEWGDGLAEPLSPDRRLDITVLRSADPSDDTRTVLIDPIGQRWQGADLDVLTDSEVSMPGPAADG